MSAVGLEHLWLRLYIVEVKLMFNSDITLFKIHHCGFVMMLLCVCVCV